MSGLLNILPFLMLVLASGLGSQAYANPKQLSDWVRDDDPKYMVDGGVFIYPNEFRFALYHSHLKNKQGVLLGVGTFRIFENLSQGSFSHGICFDYDSGAVAFNRWIIKLMKSSKGRLEFLSKILGDVRFIPILRDFESGILSTDQLIQALSSRCAIPKSFRTYAHLVSPTKYIFEKTIEAVFHKIYASGGVSFLRSDEAFNNVKKLADAGKIEAIRGSLSGSQSLSSLSDELRKRGLAVSVIDISNAIYYFYGNARLQFLTNLKALPFQRSAEIFFTEREYIPPSQGTALDWHYYAMSVDDYLRRIEKVIDPATGHDIKGKSYQDFLNQQAPISSKSDVNACVDKLVRDL